MTGENMNCRLYAFMNISVFHIKLELLFDCLYKSYNPDSWASSPLTFRIPFQKAFLNVPSDVLTLKSSITVAHLSPVRVERSRMAAPGGAFSAALRRSQDLDICGEKHLCTLSGQLGAHRPHSLLFSSASNIQQVEPFGKLLSSVNSLISYNGNLSEAAFVFVFLDVKPFLWLGKGDFFFIWSWIVPWNYQQWCSGA